MSHFFPIFCPISTQYQSMHLDRCRYYLGILLTWLLSMLWSITYGTHYGLTPYIVWAIFFVEEMCMVKRTSISEWEVQTHTWNSCLNSSPLHSVARVYLPMGGPLHRTRLRTFAAGSFILSQANSCVYPPLREFLLPSHCVLSRTTGLPRTLQFRPIQGKLAIRNCGQCMENIHIG